LSEEPLHARIVRPIRRARRGGRSIPRLGSYRKRIAAALRLWSRKRRTRRRLLELDDRLLRDIGVSRQEAIREARRSVSAHMPFPWSEGRRLPCDPWR
jgi:uncharacterized protein YjiS (DUF1127 family)